MSDPQTAAPPARRPAAARRLLGVRATVLAAVAFSLGLTAADLRVLQRTTPVPRIAAQRHVDPSRVRAAALAAAEPQLEAALRAGAISEPQRAALRGRIGARLSL
jgi:hypothetical protein